MQLQRRRLSAARLPRRILFKQHARSRHRRVLLRQRKVLPCLSRQCLGRVFRQLRLRCVRPHLPRFHQREPRRPRHVPRAYTRAQPGAAARSSHQPRHDRRRARKPRRAVHARPAGEQPHARRAVAHRPDVHYRLAGLIFVADAQLRALARHNNRHAPPPAVGTAGRRRLHRERHAHHRGGGARRWLGHRSKGAKPCTPASHPPHALDLLLALVPRLLRTRSDLRLFWGGALRRSRRRRRSASW